MIEPDANGIGEQFVLRVEQCDQRTAIRAFAAARDNRHPFLEIAHGAGRVSRA